MAKGNHYPSSQADGRSINDLDHDLRRKPQPPPASRRHGNGVANILLSGSMSSADGIMSGPNFLARTMLPCSSNMATISASAPFPTIIFDVTQSPNPLQLQQPDPQFQLPRFRSGTSQPVEPLYNDTLSAATAAITSYPKFTAALAATISSILGGAQPNNDTEINNTIDNNANLSRN
ncbi:hypothetical protein OROMI_004312 [Orobanche minor]